ncbi:uncharacterized protein LOC143198684 [Rhynchophorus ferrugineus]|uniref:uncharacterized protein LOC143198684 n=1 Tax=Rhynchophorus ferrugineus TaxID=354439 RepID=UPI003FCD0174
MDGWQLPFYNYFAPTTPDFVAYFFRAPPMPLLQNVYLMPFDVTSWHCILLCMGVAIILLSVVVLLNKWINVHSEGAFIVDIFMLVTSMLLQRSWTFQIKGVAGRIAIAALSISFMILFTFYSACIIIFLQKTSNTIQTFSQIYALNYGVGAANVSYSRYYFTVSADEHWRSIIYRERISKSPDKFFLAHEEGIERVRRGHFTYHLQATVAHFIMSKTFTNQEICSIRKLPGIYGTTNPYLASNKNASHTKHYKIGFLRLFETGLHKRLLRRLFMKMPKCEGHFINYNEIGLQETSFIFETFSVGVGLSFVIFLIEFSLHQYKRSLAYFKLLRKINFVQPYTE